MGNDIGERAFAEWLASQATVAPTDRNAERVLGALWPLVEREALKIPRGGYLIKRGRGRVVDGPPCTGPAPDSAGPPLPAPGHQGGAVSVDMRLTTAITSTSSRESFSKTRHSATSASLS